MNVIKQTENRWKSSVNVSAMLWRDDRKRSSGLFPQLQWWRCLSSISHQAASVRGSLTLTLLLSPHFTPPHPPSPADSRNPAALPQHSSLKTSYSDESSDVNSICAFQHRFASVTSRWQQGRGRRLIWWFAGQRTSNDETGLRLVWGFQMSDLSGVTLSENEFSSWLSQESDMFHLDQLQSEIPLIKQVNKKL